MLTSVADEVKSPGIIDGRFWWQQSSAYQELPFWSSPTSVPYFCALPNWDDNLAAREQLWAIREGCCMVFPCNCPDPEL